MYSIIKFKYFQNRRFNFIKEFKDKTIEVKNLDDINNLNPIEFECFIREFFIRKGYKAWTTKKTYDNGADVIAEKNDEKIAIQVKHSIKSINGYEQIIQAVEMFLDSHIKLVKEKKDSLLKDYITKEEPQYGYLYQQDDYRKILREIP